jgi:hypothetical protein
MSVFSKRERTVIGVTNRDVEALRQSSRFLGNSGSAFESACLTEMTGLMKKDVTYVPSPRKAAEATVCAVERSITATELLSGSRQRTVPTTLQDEIKMVPSPRSVNCRVGDNPHMGISKVLTPRQQHSAAEAAAPAGGGPPSATGLHILRNAFYPGVAVANVDPVLPPLEVANPSLHRNTRFGTHTFPDTKHLVQAQPSSGHFADASGRYNRDITGQIRNETLQTAAVREVAARNAAVAKHRCEANIAEHDRQAAEKAAARLEMKGLMLQDYQSRQLLHKYPK